MRTSLCAEIIAGAGNDFNVVSAADFTVATTDIPLRGIKPSRAKLLKAITTQTPQKKHTQEKKKGVPTPKEPTSPPPKPPFTYLRQVPQVCPHQDAPFLAYFQPYLQSLIAPKIIYINNTIVLVINPFQIQYTQNTQ